MTAISRGEILMPKDNLPDFAGKVVVFYTANAPRAIRDGTVLEFASFTEYGDRLFVTGRIPAAYSKDTEWVSNLQAGIAWDDVMQFMIFDSPEDYVNRAGRARIPLLQRLGG